MVSGGPVRRSRSWLYVPGDRPDLLAKAESSGADMIVADLEDGVSPRRKGVARETVAAWLADGPDGPAGSDRPGRVVRINAGEAAVDLAAVFSAALEGVVVPKASVEGVGVVADWLAERGVRVPLVGLIESAVGVLEAPELAACGQVTQLAMGESDLAADLSLQPSDDGHEFWPHRARVVAASAAAGLPPPVGPVSTDFRDLDALRDDTIALRRQGFRSRQAIHPAQVAVIDQVFMPTSAELAWAQDVVNRFEAADAQGSGVAVDAEGRLIDLAVVRSSREILARR